MLDLNDVALFVHVVRAGSFAAAARRLGVPSNTVSRRVQQLEGRIGARLMQRSTRRLTLTDAGQVFFARCAEQVDELEQSARDLSGGERPIGRVRVAAPADFFGFFSMGWVAEFLAAYPKVRLEFVLSDARTDLLGEGIDVALLIGKVLEPSLIARQIGSSRATLVASPAYLAARGTPGSVASLAEHDCIAEPSSSGQTTWRLDGPAGSHDVHVTGRFHANAVGAMIDAALTGLGIALLPTAISAPHVRAGELVEVLPDHGVEGVGVYFVYLSRRQLPRAVTVFIEFAMSRLIEEGLVAPVSARL